MRGASAATRRRSARKSRPRARGSARPRQDFLFVLLQGGRDEPLAAGDRLLAVVVGGHAREVRLRDLDVVAEHPVVADLQRVDPGARALRFFHLGDPLLAGTADAAQLVELRIHAVAHGAAVPRRSPAARRGASDPARRAGPPGRRAPPRGCARAGLERLEQHAERGTAASDWRSATRSRGPPCRARRGRRAAPCRAPS